MNCVKSKKLRKKNNKKKVISLVLSLMMLISTFAICIVPAAAAETCQTCGSGVTLIEHYHPATYTTPGYVLEYNPDVIPDEEIHKMAESAEVKKWKNI